MPKAVYCNVEDHRILDNGKKVEDVTKFTPPTIEHPTNTVKSAGMVMDVDVPNVYHFNAMEFSIAHNNGLNCKLLSRPGTHRIECRIARQVYNTAAGGVGLKLTKIRVQGIHKSAEKGDIETDNPYGTTEKYSVLRYEEEVDGEIVTLIDSMAGIIKVNGEDFGNRLSSMLD